MTPTNMSHNKLERQRFANLKYKKTTKGKQSAANYYQRTIDERKKTQLAWRTKCKARLKFLEEFYATNVRFVNEQKDSL